MTALRSPARPTTIAHPPARRLIGAAIVAAIGVIVLSVAFGDFVVGSRHDLPAAVASDARSLIGDVPWIALVGLVHLAVAIAMASGGGTVRAGARVASALAGVVAGGVAVAAAAGDVIPAWTGGHRPTEIVLVAVVAAAYGAAAVLAGGDATD